MSNFPTIMVCLSLMTTEAGAETGFRPTERVVAKVLAQQAHGLLDQKLHDMPSARFQNIYAVTLKLKDLNFGQLYDGFVICGQVNDIRSGWKAFAVAADNGWTGPRDVYLEDLDAGKWMIDSFCRDHQNPTLRIDENPAYLDLLTGKAQINHGE